jgi:hypothetical protein
MKKLSITRSFFVAASLLASAACAQSWLDKADDALFVQTPDGNYRADLSGLFDLEGYYVDQRPPGLIYGDDEAFVNPRLSLFLDVRAGKHFYAFAQARVDRGFDPRSKVRQARLDEYLVRYTPFDDARLNLQIGKFATVVGNWVPRHLSWDNPFINAPLPYEYVTAASDQTIVPGPVAFLKRQTLDDKKNRWMPIVWGPSYASGASIFGTIERFDYAFEAKNSSLSSRPSSWDAHDSRWEDPTFSGRLGFRPNAAWNLGASFSYGTYLRRETTSSPNFPAGKHLDDFNQITFAHDIGYAWHHWQFWGEVFLSRFEVPNVGDADTLAYYIETKYKLTTKLFAAVRWNQQFFDTVDNGAGGETAWDRDVWRAETALGYRFTRHLQGKLQYSYSRQKGPLQQGEQLVAAQATLKF